MATAVGRQQSFVSLSNEPQSACRRDPHGETEVLPQCRLLKFDGADKPAKVTSLPIDS